MAETPQAIAAAADRGGLAVNKLRVLDLFSKAPILLAGSSSCQVRRGTSGKVSIQQQASCSRWSAMRHSDDALAYVLHQALWFRHTTDRREELRESGGKIGSSYRRVHAFPLPEHNTPLCAQDSAHRILSGSPVRSALSILKNSASGCSRLYRKSKSANRIVCNDVLTSLRPFSAASETSLYSPSNTTLRWPCLLYTRSRKSRSVCGVLP